MFFTQLLEAELNPSSNQNRSETAERVISVVQQREQSLIAVQQSVVSGDLERASSCLEDAFRLATVTDSASFWDRCVIWKAWLEYLSGEPSKGLSVIVPFL